MLQQTELLSIAVEHGHALLEQVLDGFLGGAPYAENHVPTLSVTLIGPLVGAAVVVVARSNEWTTLLVGLVGVSIGFVFGAVIGVALDTIAGTGVWLALVGHVMALVGAAVAVGLRLARPVASGR